MSLKTSFFSSSIFKANIKRFWWISAILFVAVLTFALLPLIEFGDTDGYLIMNVLSIGYSIIVPPLLFSYLNSTNSVTCMHAFPIKRSTHYITNIISIAVILFVPVIIGTVVGLGYLGISESVYEYMPDNNINEMAELGEMFLMNIVLVIIFAGASLLGIMITGNTVAAIAFGALFAGFPFYTELIFKSFLEYNVYGIWGNDYITLNEFRFDEFNLFMGIMLGVGILCYIGAWFLYKYRKLETNGDIISFKWLKPIFIAGVSVYMGFLGYFYLSTMFDNNIFFMLPFGLLGVIIANMLSKKAFTFKGVWKPGLLYIAAVFILFAGIKYDITGFERRIPDIEDIQSVNVIDEQIYNDTQFDSRGSERMFGGQTYYYANPKKLDDYAFTEKEDIQNVINLHKYMIGLKGTENRATSDNLPVVYKLKNGKTIKRIYRISYSEDRQYLEPVFMADIMKNKKYSYFDYKDAKLVHVSITDDRLIDGVTNTKIFEASAPEAEALINALKEDIKNVTYEELTYENRGTTSINLQFVRPMVDERGEEVTSGDVFTETQQYCQIIISPNFKNTVKLLYEYGLFENIPTVDDISRVVYRFNDGEKRTITDKTQIAELYSYCKYNDCKKELGGLYTHIELEFFEGENIFLSQYYSGIDDTVPQFLMEEAKKYYSYDDYSIQTGIMPAETATITRIE